MYECGALTLTRASLLVLMISIGELLSSFEKIKEKDLKSTELDQPLHVIEKVRVLVKLSVFSRLFSKRVLG